MTARFEDMQSIGEGGMATVYSATDVQLGRQVAIKELAPTLAENERHVVMFVSEAQKMAAINHPNVVNIHAIDDDGSRPPRIVMELARETFRRYIAAGPSEPVLVEKVGRHTLQGLDAIHRAGIVHRDIKPANILYFENGFFKIGDFGIATDGEEHTQLLATPKYMAPEVLLRPHLVGPASDLYSLGLVLYEALLGTPRFVETVERVAGEETAPTADPSGSAAPERHLWQTFHGSRGELPLLHELDSHIPESLSRWIGQLVRKDIGERFKSCREALNSLDKGSTTAGVRQLYGAELTQQIEVSAPKKGLTGLQIGLLLAVVIVSVAGAWWLFPGRGRIPVEITSNPSGASIFYQGKKIAETPHGLPMKPGISVSLELAGFETHPLLLEPDARATDEEPYPLHAEMRWQEAVPITSQPEGARIEIDGESVDGRTPFDLRGHGGSVEVRLSLEGYESAELEIRARDGATHLRLLPELPERDAIESPRQLASAFDALLSEDGSIRFELVAEESPILRFGEQLRLRTRVADASHAVLFLLQASGDILLLYPSPRAGGLELEPGLETILPPVDHVSAGYRIVATAPAGTDRAFLLTSADPPSGLPAGKAKGKWTTLYPFSGSAETAFDFVRWVAEERRDRPETTFLVDTRIRVEPAR